MNATRPLIHAILPCLFAGSAVAGGPLHVEGPTGTIPVVYDDPNITINLDPGPLGTVLSNSEADLLVSNAIALWNDVSTSKLVLTIGADMPEDIEVGNYSSYIPVPGTSIHNDEDGRNPVVYDSTGEIIDAFFGDNEKRNIIGFAASSYFINASQYTEGFVVINGYDGIDRTTLPSAAELTLTIAHEIGHFFGLDHSQGDIDPDHQLSCWRAESAYPLMYPLACRDSYALHPDDAASLSAVYPGDTLENSYGQITGTFRVAGTNQAIRGANIWVRNPFGEVYSVVSDFLEQNTGLFSLRVPPGTYTLHANPVNLAFFGGSSVGPYAETQADLSFQPPASTIGDVSFIADGGSLASLTVTAGEAVEVTFLSDGSGTYSEGNAVSNPAQQVPQTDGGILNSSSGSGALAGWTLALLLLPRVLRRALTRYSTPSRPRSRTA